MEQKLTWATKNLFMAFLCVCGYACGCVCAWEIIVENPGMCLCVCVWLGASLETAKINQ